MVEKVRSKKRRKPERRDARPLAIRLTPAMKAELDEVALEWRTTRAAVIRELMDHALRTYPRTKLRK